MVATVTSKGQVTLPAKVRKQLGIRPGSKLEFIIREDERLEVIPLASSVRSLKGMLPKPARPVSLRAMREAISRGALG